MHCWFWWLCKLQNVSIAAAAQAVEVQADLLLDSSVKMKRLQNVLSSRTWFLWLYWQWVGDQNCGLLSVLRMNFLVYGQILCCRTDSPTMKSDGGVQAQEKKTWIHHHQALWAAFSVINYSMIFSKSTNVPILATSTNHERTRGLAASPRLKPNSSPKNVPSLGIVSLLCPHVADSLLHKDILNFND